MNFAKILESKLRQEIAREYQPPPPPQNKRPSLDPLIQSELWTQLVGNLSPQRFETSQKAGVYHRFRKPLKPRPAHTLNAEQAQSFQFFKSYGSELADNFTSKDLKSAFRKLALKLHPDQGGRTENFLSLQKAFDRLQTVHLKV